MKRTGWAALAVMTASQAGAGGIDRSGQWISTLFEPGEVAEFSLGYVAPDVSGVFMGAANSGDMAGDYALWSFGYKRPLNERFDLAVIIDQPFGADVDYPISALPYPIAGTTATLRSTAVTALGRYHFDERFSVHGGLRIQRMTGEVDLWSGGASSYTLDAESDVALGYVVGVAYEIPDIALRAALTYNSEITHNVDSLEQGVVNGSFELVTPQSWNLEFQTGIAENTLLMASVRWAEWDGFDISPPNYPNLVAYTDNRISYTLGVGRRFNEHWSGSVTLGYEPPVGGLSSNLSPTDGYRSIAFGAAYTQGNVKISGGLRYLQIGDATTSTLNSDFSGNSGWAAGLKVTYTF